MSVCGAPVINANGTSSLTCSLHGGGIDRLMLALAIEFSSESASVVEARGVPPLMPHSVICRAEMHSVRYKLDRNAGSEITRASHPVDMSLQPR